MKQDEKALYFSGKAPQVIEVPTFRYIMIEGAGDPNGPDYEERVGALYALSYTIKMGSKKGTIPQGAGADYAVYPLEGVYGLMGDAGGDKLDKDALVYTLMIRQPDFVTDEVFAQALAAAAKKRDVSPKLAETHVGTCSDGLCVQALHVGSYDDESTTFAGMNTLCLEQGLVRRDSRHREVYYNDPRRTAPDKLRTLLRYFVAKT